MNIKEMYVPFLTLISLPRYKYYSYLIVSLQTFFYEYSIIYTHVYTHTHIFCLYQHTMIFIFL